MRAHFLLAKGFNDMSTAPPPTHPPRQWQFRFDFFETNGMPNSQSYKTALRVLPLWQRVRLRFNILAFFLGPVYLFVLGLWKANLTLLATLLLITLLEAGIEWTLGFPLPLFIDCAINLVWGGVYASVTNALYYRLKVKGEQSWNPFVSQ